MSFPNNVKIDVMVKSNRRCCVCHRHSGVGVEVHHIKPKASGGQNTLDNAIALCFDCHAAAGHYNPKHPRGTKYSPKELLRHRDEWWKLIELAGISDVEPENVPAHSIRHLVCMDYQAAKEILNKEGDNFPFDFQYLEENCVAQFMRHALTDKLPYTWAGSSDGEGVL